ncbi:MAG: hypothetical protein J6X44_06725, partial [Thermoguttaceae bacterium]|nr:hypothetical protein [Thermoguttaceae bacterium]
GKPGVIVFFRSIHFQNYRQLFSLLQKYARCEGANVAGYIVDGNPKYIGNIPEIAGLNVVSRIMTLEAKEADYLDVGLYYGYGVDVPHSQIAQSSTPMVVIYDEQGKIVQYQEAQLFPVETFLCQQSPEIVRKEDERIRELLDFPEGKNAAFYLEKYQALTGETVRYYGHVIPVYAEQFVKRFNDGNPYFAERFKNLEQKITEAIQKTVKLLAQTPEDDDSVAPSQKREFYDSYVENLKLEKDRAAMTELLDFERTQGEFGRERVYALERDLADLDFELARETDDKNALENLQKLLDDESKSDNPHVDNMRYFTRRVLEIKIENAIGEDDESALKEALDECVEAETVEDEDLQKRPEFLYIKDIMNALKGGYNRPDDAEYLRKSALNKFKSSETPRAKQLASELAAVDRRDSLKGKTLIFRGSYYNPDDSSDSPTFDWNGARYRGRPVLIFCYGLDDIDAGLEDIRGIYQKFYVHNNAGLEVLGYYDGSRPAFNSSKPPRYVPRTFAEEYKKRNIHWQTVWNKRGADRSIHYESLVKYYDLPTPSAILVDADGKVIDVFKIGAFSGRLYEELRKLFPNVQ